MDSCKRLLLYTVLLTLVPACHGDTENSKNVNTTQKVWSAEHLSTVVGFSVPECAMCDEDTGLVYVANIESKPDEYWSDDGKGHISIVGTDRHMKAARWVDSCTESILNSPKGMCVLGEHLYFTDNTRLMRCSASTGGEVEMVAAGFEKANDLATDGKEVWLSDTVGGKVFCISPDGSQREIPAPAGVNGLTFFEKRLFAVSWDLHEVYELDPLGKNPPVAFGLADRFSNLDGIEVLDDGTFVVSDFTGNRVYTISPDRSTVETLVEISTPADIGLNRKDQLLYVPQFMEDKVAVFQIK